MHSLQPTNVTFQLINPMAQKVSDDRISGWLQRAAGDPACRDPIARGRHMGFINRGFLPLLKQPEKGQGMRANRLSSLFSRFLLEAISTRGYFIMTAGFEISIHSLELPRVIEPHLPVCQSYHWRIDSNMWSSSTTRSLDPIVVTTRRVNILGECLGTAACAIASNCQMPEP